MGPQSNYNTQKKLEKAHANKESIYKVYENDDYGRPTRTLGYVKAKSSDEAREMVSMKIYTTTDTPIVKSGYYGAKSMTDEEYSKAYCDARLELQKFDRNLL